jgi:cell division protein FtsB
MDIRLSIFSKIRNVWSRQEGLRLVYERAPQAEALAASWMDRAQPVFARVYAIRRKAATIMVGVLAVLLFVHVMFGANGMMVYKQKRAEYELLKKKTLLEEKENELYTQRIQALKTDAKAIEKEAREQLRYARPGEFVYVPSSPASPVPPANHSAKR